MTISGVMYGNGDTDMLFGRAGNSESFNCETVYDGLHLLSVCVLSEDSEISVVSYLADVDHLTVSLQYPDSDAD